MVLITLTALTLVSSFIFSSQILKLKILFPPCSPHTFQYSALCMRLECSWGQGLPPCSLHSFRHDWDPILIEFPHWLDKLLRLCYAGQPGTDIPIYSRLWVNVFLADSHPLFHLNLELKLYIVIPFHGACYEAFTCIFLVAGGPWSTFGNANEAIQLPHLVLKSNEQDL